MIDIPDPTKDFTPGAGKKLFADFLWDGKKDKIKRKSVYRAFGQGGLKMVNIHEYLSAMKRNWLRRVFQPDDCLAKNILFAV